MRVNMPSGSRYQCPACGTPVQMVEFRYEQTPSGYGLALEDCGHVVTLQLIRDAWDIDIPDPDPRRVVYPTT